jgi:hypothetical protein
MVQLDTFGGIIKRSPAAPKQQFTSRRCVGERERERKKERESDRQREKRLLPFHLLLSLARGSRCCHRVNVIAPLG